VRTITTPSCWLRNGKSAILSHSAPKRQPGQLQPNDITRTKQQPFGSNKSTTTKSISVNHSPLKGYQTKPWPPKIGAPVLSRKPKITKGKPP
jgi:hypothetical protein